MSDGQGLVLFLAVVCAVVWGADVWYLVRSLYGRAKDPRR
jgi:hypothetical protein